MLLLQYLYNLSDSKSEDQVSNRLSFHKCIGLSFHTGVLDYTTICRFRERLIFVLLIILFLEILSHPTLAQENSQIIVLKGKAGVEAIFEVRDSFGRWIAYRDAESGQNWDIRGPAFYLQTPDGKRATISEKNFTKALRDSKAIVFEPLKK